MPRASCAHIRGTTGRNGSNAINIFGLVAFLTWCVWILAMSAFMWRRAGKAS
jgi:hypothetical protein